MKEWYTPQELTQAGLPGLPETVSALIRRAKKSAWQSRQREFGKGLEYHLAALPPDAQLALLAIESAPILAETPAPPAKRAPAIEDPTARAAGDAQAAQLQGKARARMDARLEILRQFEQFCAENPIKGARKSGGQLQKEAFAAAWNRGAIDSPAREVFPVISSDKIAHWTEHLRQKGLAGLSGRYGHRKGTGLIDSQPQLASALRALLLDHPHAKAAQAAEWLAIRYDASIQALPGPRTVGRWLESWKSENAELYTRMRDPDAWKNRYMIGWGDASNAVQRLNQLWEFDSTPADILLKDGRHSILGVIDVYSRRVRLHVSKTSRATAVASLLRGALLDWGVPEIAKTDNGQEYVSNHVKRIFQTLEIEQRLSAPFSPWQKPFIERFFRSFSHDLIEFLPGYAGHNVAEREALRARQQFSDRLFVKDRTIELALTATELQAFCDRWVQGYHGRPHSGLNGKRPIERLANWRQPIRTVANERALDLLLSEAPGDGWRTVTKSYGLRIDSYEYVAIGLPVGDRVRVLYDPEDDMGRVYVFDGKGQFLAIAECPEVTGIDRKELIARCKADQKAKSQTDYRALKDEAKAVGIRDIASEMLAERENASRALVPFPSRGIEHSTAALSGAADALTGKPALSGGEITPEDLRAAWGNLSDEAKTPKPAAPVVHLWDFDSQDEGMRAVVERTLGSDQPISQEDADYVADYYRDIRNCRIFESGMVERYGFQRFHAWKKAALAQAAAPRTLTEQEPSS